MDKDKLDEQPVQPPLEECLDRARRACARRGFNIDDPEFGSLIAASVWRSHERGKPITFIVANAIQECGVLRRKLDKQRAKVSSIEGQELEEEIAERLQTIPNPSVLTEIERQLLSFVAKHGALTAAKLLEMAPATLKKRLDQIHLRVHLASSEPVC